MTFREYIKASGTSPNPQFRMKASAISSPIDNLSSAGPSIFSGNPRPVAMQEASVRPNRFMSFSREREPRVMSQQEQLRVPPRNNSGPKISLFPATQLPPQRRPEFPNFRNSQFNTTTYNETVDQLGLPQESSLMSDLKPLISLEIYLRFLAKLDGNHTILMDVFYGTTKHQFQELLQQLKVGSAHTCVVLQRLQGGQCHLFIISAKELLHFQFSSPEAVDEQQGYFLNQNQFATNFTLHDRCEMMDRARSLHAVCFKCQSLVIPTTNEFPSYGTQELQMCSLYLMCLLRQKLTGKQPNSSQLRDFCFDERNLGYLKKLISNDLIR